MTSSNPDRSGRPLAVITGGSSGIGAAFARRVAADHDVVLVARRPDRLASVRDELARDHPDGRFDTVTADLSTSDGTGAVVERLARGGVDLLVNNAGAGYHGRFVDEPSDRIAAEVALDCVAVALLTRAALPSMVAAGHGAVVNISSTAAFQPVATMAVYGAAKAFVLSLSEALHVETRDTGVTILAVCPEPGGDTALTVRADDGVGVPVRNVRRDARHGQDGNRGGQADRPFHPRRHNAHMSRLRPLRYSETGHNPASLTRYLRARG
jgi:short-subunit dehydrogenase